eukprot:TRINITY_DN16645_c0_g2_i1.p1 TRINITY_DN16645_c0_g2~~TRINITY_DN16645_c0_g2_i1.p1  ORF type:complete len:839 (+),score=228.63 TRINITY_DN16645_c0_g2_i1:48-2564(+)
MLRVCAAAAAAVCAAGAGMNTHSMTGHLAAQYYGRVRTSPNASRYNAAIAGQPNAVAAGADFPDFLYACGKYADHHDAAEAAHWPPWQAAAIRYVRDRPDFEAEEWSEETQRLVAFIFGVSVHYITDELWEGLTPQLGAGQGFVRTLSTMNLGHDGRTDNDEGVANLAADFYMSYALDERGVRPWKRDFPVKAIAEVYHQYAGFPDVTEASLAECVVLFDLGAWAEKAFGVLLFQLYAEVVEDVPYVAERVLDLPLAGVDDLAVWAGWVWERVARWFDNGPPGAPPPRARPGDPDGAWTRRFFNVFAPFKKHAAALQAIEDPSGIFRLVDPLRPLAGVTYHGPEDTHVKLALVGVLEALMGAVFAPPLALTAGDITVHQVPPAPAAAAAPPPFTAAPTQAGEVPVAYHGHSLAAGDFDGDGAADLATGAYGVGVPGAAQVGEVRVEYNRGGGVLLPGPMPHARFGWALATVDFNADGVDDLAVGAPEAAWNGALPVTDAPPAVRLWGRVYVFLGTQGRGLDAARNVTLTTATDFTGLGSVLGTGDINGDGVGDLLMGCPLFSTGAAVRTGKVFGVVSAAAREAGAVVDVDTAADLTVPGQSQYESFGRAVAVVAGSNAAPPRLVVGAPGYRTNRTTTVGRVYGFDVAAVGNGTRVHAVPAFSLTGAGKLGEFGHAVAVKAGTGVFAVSAPAAGSGLKLHSGEVMLFNAYDLGAREADAAGAATSVLTGACIFGRFGMFTAFDDVDGDGESDLVVSAPLCSALLGREEGAAYVWFALPASGTASGADWHLKGRRLHARLGTAVVGLSPGTLALASPRASLGGMERTGAVDVVSRVVPSP